MTALLDKICMVLLSMMYLPLACSYSCGLSCKAAEDGLIFKQVLQLCLLSIQGSFCCCRDNTAKNVCACKLPFCWCCDLYFWLPACI